MKAKPLALPTGWKLGSHEYLVPALEEELRCAFSGHAVDILDLGCGPGHVSDVLSRLGHSVVGVDSDSDRVAAAREAYPAIAFHTTSVYDDELADVLPTRVDCVVALEVIEHLYAPQRLFVQAARLLRPRGRLILSTPYHGYLKNLALAVVGGWDEHFLVDREGGHIKFFSRASLLRMATANGFVCERWRGVGRFPGLWKSMVAVFRSAHVS